MQRSPMWRRYLRFFGSDIRADVADELQFHLQAKSAELIEQGWPKEDALREAYRQFGDIEAVRRTCEFVAKERERRMKSYEQVVSFSQDVKYAALQLRRSLGTTVLMLSALGAGMGVVTAVFSIVYAVVLQPLPFPSPERLVSVWSTRDGRDDDVTPRNFEAWRREAKSFRQLGALQATTFTLSQGESTAQIAGGLASAGYFQSFGLSPELGRTFTAEEDRSPRLHLAVLSHRLWQEKFNADRGVIGRQIRLNREAFTVIGVMPKAFSIRPGSEEVWAPLALSGQEMNWTGGVLSVIGKLQPGITREQAQSEMNVLARYLAWRYPDVNRHRGIRVGDYAADLVGDYRSRLFILLGAVSCVLLIAYANAANLLLARSAARAQELAVRAAVGASRARIVRQLLTESMLIGLIGEALGLALAQILVMIVRKLGLDAIPRLNGTSVNGTIFLFALGLAVLCAVLAGLLPALRAAQTDIQTVLRKGGRSASGLARDGARNIYIAAEVALALVLLVGAGLLIRTAMAAKHTRPGFSPRLVVSARTALPPNVYRTSQQVIGAYGRILQELRERPEVTSAALTSKAPLSISTVGLALTRNSVASLPEQEFATELHYISEGYISTMQIPLLNGREFSVHDRTDSTQVVLISDALARHLWPEGRAVGRTLRIPELEGRTAVWEIAGVVADVRVNGTMSEAPPTIYVPLTQVSGNPWHWVEQSLYLVARTKSDSMNMATPLKAALSAVDRELPLSDVRTMDQRLARSAAIALFYTVVLTILGGCGLLLTVAGIYGVVSYFVSRQRAEIGVRLALGSTKSGVLLLVLWQGMRPVLAGLVIGLVTALGSMRLIASQLYGVSTTDPRTLSAVTLVLLVVAALACYLPARQAARVDPMVALRNE